MLNITFFLTCVAIVIASVGCTAVVVRHNVNRQRYVIRAFVISLLASPIIAYFMTQG